VVIAVTFSPPLYAPPKKLVHEVLTILSDDYRLRHIGVRRMNRGMNASLQVDVGGSQLPSPALKQQLRKIARKHMAEDIGVRLTFRYEAMVK
jgi:hypothetical protein